MSAQPTLTVVIPAYNQEREIGPTLRAVERAVHRGPFAADVVVVDDGSSDATGDAARNVGIALPLEVVRQENAGRLAARRRGLGVASGDFVLLIDSRVAIDEDALRFVGDVLATNASQSVWNAHVEVDTVGNPYGVFWDVLTQNAFSTYFSEPRTTSFGSEEFDAFPKGTTCFLAPRLLLVEAFAVRSSGYADERYANDDTVALRQLAAGARINISPGFRCTYEPRRNLKGFGRHAYHRGIVFLDGHGRRGTRLYPVVIAFYPLSVAWLALATRSRVAAVAPLGLAAVVGAALALRLHRAADVPVTAALAPVYALAHGAGMWRGALMLLVDGQRRRT